MANKRRKIQSGSKKIKKKWLKIRHSVQTSANKDVPIVNNVDGNFENFEGILLSFKLKIRSVE